MNTFGTPEQGSRDATDALAVAVDISKFFEGWKEKQAAPDMRNVGIGVGVHSGPVVVGDIGTQDRLEFAVMGMR
ncbi:adenylate/guanylate cyclase domain-containing protein [Phaeobacter sp. C3_T13_0]|uniref:adenylate/guanylate cyclase domain-containing protein n=1 Tax=Phaeobacter cretensis TaxID=3342641 RepID=UPI0039BC4B88